MEDAAENERVVGQDGDAHDVAEPVLQGTEKVILDLDVAQPQRPRRPDRRRYLRPAVGLGIAPDLLEDGGAQDVLRHLGDVQGLEDERADLFLALEPIVPGPGQVEGPAGAGHGHVEEPPFLLEIVLRSRQDLLEDPVRDRDPFPPLPAGEAVLDEADEKDRPELESLGLVDRQDVDGVLVELRLRRGRVVADLTEQVEVPGEGADGVVVDEVGEPLDLVEKEADVLDPDLGLEAHGADQST